MLKRLSINNFAIIDSIDIEFPDGLIIISGETGAGKSILMGGLSLLLGGKSDPSQILDKEKNCVIEGEFDLSKNNEIRSQICQILEDESIDNILVIRRVISANGRSRIFINDIPVSLAVMSQISLKLIDIHAQHATLLLNDNDFQMSILDHFSDSLKELEEYRRCNGMLQKCRSELDAVEKRIENNTKELDYKLFQLEKLQQADLKAGELEDLEIEQKQLSTAEDLKNSLYSALNLLMPNGVSLVQNFKEIKHILERYTDVHTNLGSLVERFESMRIECKDLEEEIERAAERCVVSPDRLAEVNERLNTLYSLMKKNGVSTIEELINERDRISSEVLESNNDIEIKERLQMDLKKYDELRSKAASALSQRRYSKVHELEKILQERIRELEMPDAVFKVSLVSGDNFTSLGCDEICFMFSANKGVEPAKLQKIASGGELSRIMLCLKWLMARFIGMPTMIFDEIDTGVSGKIADKMGLLIDELGKNMQVFSITHLPQIASKGKTHLLVYKETVNNKTITKLKLLNKEERILEVARMLSGRELSEAAIENARFLLNS